ncbi:MAG: DNA-directed RNA polymerase subunit A' [Methanobrevibacter sp.]|jgi:DNA-directed RNA polymerase subunit A'|nr:DNA-directed RNA polymerase subunit A' [Candidatus Methanoflexus mossambicus]
MREIIKKIKDIELGIMSPETIRKNSVIKIETHDTYDPDGFPARNGLMDLHLGVIDPSLECKTCGSKGGKCPGHFGHIDLARPVVHILYSTRIYKILSSVCTECNRVLLSEEDIEKYKSILKDKYLKKEHYDLILREIYGKAKAVKKCPHCGGDTHEIKFDPPTYYYESMKIIQNDIIDILRNIPNEEKLLLGDIGSKDNDDNVNLYKNIDLSVGELDSLKIEQLHDDMGLVCNHCNHILLSDDEIKKYHKKVLKKLDEGFSFDDLELLDILNEIRSIIAENHECPRCGEKPKKFNKKEIYKKTDFRLTPSEIRDRFEKISDDDIWVLGLNPKVARPEWLVLTVLPVPPVTVRPTITLEHGERSEDDLTHKLVEILRTNQKLSENMEAGAPQLIVEDIWELLQYHVTTYFDNEASGVPQAKHRSKRPLKTLAQRLKGKDGRYRLNLNGKRVNFSARTVISPDPNISINEVGVPEMIAKEVTVPVQVNEWNIDEMKEYINNGPDIHPGANYVIRLDERKVRVFDDTKEKILEDLEPGYIVERHLKDGDIVVFNRQPSIHRMSMMAHEVKVLPYKTFRLNLCVCPPYNADFDGDEMNMHILQTDEARSEAKYLMRVQENILSPRFGGPIIGAIHDHISGAYLLTKTGTKFTEEKAFQIIRKANLPIPKRKNPEETPDGTTDWTGKELFSLVIPKVDSEGKPKKLNSVYKAEICRNCNECLERDCDYDAYVVIEDSELKTGAIDVKAYGAGSGSKILTRIVREYGSDIAREFLDNSTTLAISGIMEAGITTSINDEEIPQEAQDRIEAHLDDAEKKVDVLVNNFRDGLLEPLPGFSLEETLEMGIMQVLGEARDKSGEIAENYFSIDTNHSVVMAKTGARASMLNLTMIAACVGQQSVRGGRISRGYEGRALPHFEKNELGAKARGFVHSSYKSGLDPIEFYFHAMGAREGLVDTALRTGKSGYDQRRMVTPFVNLRVDENGVVREKDSIIQTMYGEDGAIATKTDGGCVVDLDDVINEMRIKK